MAELNEAIPEEKDKLIFYRSIVLLCDGIVRLANRYAEKAREMAAEEKDEARKAELLEIAATCEAVPENPRNPSARQSSSHGSYSWAALSPKTLWH